MGNELEKARRRIKDDVERKARVASEIEPQLDALEERFLKALPENLMTLLQETKEEIEAATGLAMRQTTQFIFYEESRSDFTVYHIVKTGAGKSEVRNTEISSLHFENVEKNSKDLAPLKLEIGRAFFCFTNSNSSIAVAFGLLYGKLVFGFYYGFGNDKTDFNSIEYNLDSTSIDKLAEKIVHVIENKDYFKKNTKKSIKQDPDTNTYEGQESSQEFENHRESEGRGFEIDRLQEAQYLGMLEEERLDVLREIRLREAQDSNYQRPAWIPQDTGFISDFDRASGGGRIRNDDQLDEAIRRNFPRPPSGD